MKLVLLPLDGDREKARARLRALYPQADVEVMPRNEVERGNLVERLKRLRARRPQVFAVAAERLTWLRGADMLLLYGALGGAHTSLLIDDAGHTLSKSRTEILAHAPLRATSEALTTFQTLRRARKELHRLERAASELRSGNGQAVNRSSRSVKHTVEPNNNVQDHIEIAYLRAPTGAGAQVGGASSHINGFVNAAVRLGARVRMIGNEPVVGLDKKSVEETIIKVHARGTSRAVFGLNANLSFTEDLKPELTARPPDFIYERYSRFSWAGVASGITLQRPLFLEYNGSEVWMGKHWNQTDMVELLTRCEQLNLRAAARVVVVSEVERDNLLRAGIEPEKIIVNPNGVDAEEFRPDIGGVQVRHELSVDDDETLVGFVGTFGPWHGVLQLAEAATRIGDQTRIKFLMIGHGVLRDEAKKIAREGGAAGRVIFTGAVAHEQVPALLDACDILASPHVPLADGTPFFGSPTKLFEYMSMGKAIVASRLGQIGEVLIDGENAVLVEPGNVSELVEAIRKLAASKETRARLGAAAREAALAHHTWQHNAERVLNAYLELSS